jgi:hypothetical protein
MYHIRRIFERPDTNNDCAGEDQKQYTRETDPIRNSQSRATEEYGDGSRGARYEE